MSNKDIALDFAVLMRHDQFDNVLRYVAKLEAFINKVEQQHGISDQSIKNYRSWLENIGQGDFYFGGICALMETQREYAPGYDGDVIRTTRSIQIVTDAVESNEVPSLTVEGF